MHKEGVRQLFEDQFATMEQRLAGMEKVVGELKGLQAHMVEFQMLQDFVVALLMCLESQILRLERVESDTDDEEQVEGKDQEPMIDQSTVEMFHWQKILQRERLNNGFFST